MFGSIAVTSIVVAAKAGRIIEEARSQKPGGRGVSGSLQEMGLPDVIQILANGRKNGRLKVRGGGLHGEMMFQDGSIHDAVFGDLPFYEELEMGGSSTVRGLAASRDRGEGRLLANVELRWPGLDAAAGKDVRYELEMMISAPGGRGPGYAKNAPVIQSATTRHSIPNGRFPGNPSSDISMFSCVLYPLVKVFLYYKTLFSAAFSIN